MRTTKYLIMTVILSISFTGCNNDDDPKPPGPGGEGDITVQLKLSDVAMVSYAASDTDNEPATPGESQLDDKLEVYVFEYDSNNDDGKFEYRKQLKLNNNLTDSFQITTGPKFFYVFSHLTAGNIPDPQAGSSRADFEKNIRLADIGAANTSISEDGKFFIGTLWADTARVYGSGTAANPEVIPLEVGRLAAKINLTSVKSKAGGNLMGNFTNSTYRIRSIPRKFYLVGQHTGGLVNIPPAQDIQVKSAVHAVADTVSANYTSYDFPTSPNVGTAFYTIENTSEAGDDGNVYFGSTTHIQLRAKYEPDDSEVYSGTDGSASNAAALINGTFYTGILNGSQLIFDSDPTQGTTGATNVKVYNEGLNYYNLPIKDVSESNISLQTSIIRNHYYEVSVINISRLGENTEYIDPPTPIKDDKDIQLQITVLPWSKIKYPIDI